MAEQEVKKLDENTLEVKTVMTENVSREKMERWLEIAEAKVTKIKAQIALLDK